MKNMTLTIVAALVAVAMLSAVLAVPMQEANAEKRDGDKKDGDKKDGKDGDKKDGKDGGNNLEINQKQECERAGCDQDLGVFSIQNIED